MYRGWISPFKNSNIWDLQLYQYLLFLWYLYFFSYEHLKTSTFFRQPLLASYFLQIKTVVVDYLAQSVLQARIWGMQLGPYFLLHDFFNQYFCGFKLDYWFLHPGLLNRDMHTKIGRKKMRSLAIKGNVYNSKVVTNY